MNEMPRIGQSTDEKADWYLSPVGRKERYWVGGKGIHVPFGAVMKMFKNNGKGSINLLTTHPEQVEYGV